LIQLNWFSWLSIVEKKNIISFYITGCWIGAGAAWRGSADDIMVAVG